MIPFRIKFIPRACIDEAKLIRNVVQAQRFPLLERGEHAHPVAVCGGGPSLDASLETLRNWPGDIWAINGTATYLIDRGIDCTLLTVDPLIVESKATKRILATCCDPVLFEGDVRCFSLYEHSMDGVPGGTTTATRTPALALRLGYPGVVFFGCDSSFEGADHIDRDEQLPEVLIVRADGKDHKTYPEFYLQAQCLSDVIREFPQVFSSMSGGLLDAMVKDPDWHVVAVSEALKKSITEYSGESNLYDKPYEGPQCHRSE